MAINGILRAPFQKSKCFLFPGLGIPKTDISTKLHSYMSWGGHFTIDEQRLLVTKGGNIDDKPFQRFEKTFLMQNKAFETLTPASNGDIVYVMNMQSFAEDWKLVVEGRYSKLSPRLKECIRSYFGPESKHYGHMHCYLYPHKYYQSHARWYNAAPLVRPHLNVTEEMLREVGELCNQTDLKQESLEISLS